MKVLIVVARLLLGLVFVFFGLNGFLHFLPQPPMPEAAQAFFTGMAASKYLLPLLFGTQVVGGALLCLGSVPFGLLILAPVIVNILGFHLFVEPSGLPLAIIVAAIALFLAWAHRAAYRPLFRNGH